LSFIFKKGERRRGGGGHLLCQFYYWSDAYLNNVHLKKGRLYLLPCNIWKKEGGGEKKIQFVTYRGETWE